jgi:hypothetical protein
MHMPDFGRNALLLSYRWGDEENAGRHLIEGPEDIIDRENGYHMLNFINGFMLLCGLISRESFNRVEKLVCHKMPKRIVKRSEMVFWLTKNWNKRF